MPRDNRHYEYCIRAVESLVPYVRNARVHSSAQISQLAGSITEFGFTNPLLIDESGNIIAGHGRLLAAQQLRIEQVPCIVVEGLTKTQRKALVLADNRLAEKASWNNEMLLMELGELAEDGFDLASIGFDPSDMEALLHGIGPDMGLGEDEGPGTPPVIPVTVPGDLWLLGRHRLLCGDSTVPEHVDRVMGGDLADIVFTSPPYGQQRAYEAGISDWDKLMQGVFGILPTKPTAQVLVNLGLIHRDVEWVDYWRDWVEFMREGGWRKFGWYVWDQMHGLQGDFRGRLAPSFEFIFHFNKEIVKPRRTVPKKPENIKDMSHKKVVQKDAKAVNRTFDTINYSPKSSLNTHKIPDSVIRVQRHSGGLGDVGSHPAVYPVDLVAEMLNAFSNLEQIAFEPFSGSGTTIIACQKLGRSCRAIELAPAYVDVACKRYAKFSGVQPVLESTGETFDEVAEKRER